MLKRRRNNSELGDIYSVEDRRRDPLSSRDIDYNECSWIEPLFRCAWRHLYVALRPVTGDARTAGTAECRALRAGRAHGGRARTYVVHSAEGQSQDADEDQRNTAAGWTKRRSEW